VLRRLRIENLVLIRDAELELAPGLNAITGETGAGKTILAQAIGLLLGTKGDTTAVAADAAEAYVEAELDLPDGLLDEDGLEAFAELRPEDEDSLVLARRVSQEGRTRAYAWGRSVARDDLAAVAERLIAMSGQFEQRRLARPGYQLDVLDAFVGEVQQRRRAEVRRAWRGLVAARRRHEELERGLADEEARLEELRSLAAATDGLEPGLEDELRAERERLRHVTELAAATAAAAAALAGEEGDGATASVGAAERELTRVVQIAPELGTAAAELRDTLIRLQETATELRAFLASLEAEPDRLEQVEIELDRIAGAKRRFRCQSYEELVQRGADARTALDAAARGADPAAEAAQALARAGAEVEELSGALHRERVAASEPFARAVAAELREIGLGEGEFTVELRAREPGPTGVDDTAFLIRPNPGIPLAPVAETASGGELSRIALAIAAVGGQQRRTMIFDEIDAGIGGRTAHAVGETLRRLAERAQVVTITHLPQIAGRADRHFRVEKVPGDPTHTRIEELDEAARRDELERMVGGKELLALLRNELR
jgi:DNA repair protein RecN (Recombination protein N)